MRELPASMVTRMEVEMDVVAFIRNGDLIEFVGENGMAKVGYILLQILIGLFIGGRALIAREIDRRRIRQPAPVKANRFGGKTEPTLRLPCQRDKDLREFYVRHLLEDTRGRATQINPLLLEKTDQGRVNASRL